MFELIKFMVMLQIIASLTVLALLYIGRRRDAN